MSRKVNEVIYQTPNGTNQKGYIIDGKTYKDSAGTVRVDVGSTVPTAGGTFTLTGAGSVKTPGSTTDTLKQGYADAGRHLFEGHKASTNAINVATRQAKKETEQNKLLAKKQYEDANRTAYQAYVNASNPYGAAAENLSRIGLADSGYSETSKMQLANEYQQNIAQNARDRDAYIRELDMEYSRAKAEGDIAKANLIAEYENNVYKYGIDMAEALAAQENNAYKIGMDATNDMWQRKMYEEEAARKEKEASREQENILWERMYKLAKSGFTSSQIARILGVSEAELYRVAGR